MTFIDGVDIFYVTDAQIGAAKAGSIPNGVYFLGLTGNKYETAQGPDGKMYNVIDASTGLPIKIRKLKPILWVTVSRS